MFFEEARDRRRRAQLLEEFSVVEEFGDGLMGAVALVNFGFFFVVEEVHRCCRRSARALLCCAVLAFGSFLQWPRSEYSSQTLEIDQNDAQQPTIQL